MSKNIKAVHITWNNPDKGEQMLGYAEPKELATALRDGARLAKEEIQMPIYVGKSHWSGNGKEGKEVRGELLRLYPFYVVRNGSKQHVGWIQLDLI
jgi:hypothetical protein